MAETQLEKCFECIINIFHQYSVRVDHFDMLSQGELKQLIQQQLPNYVKNAKDPKFFERLLDRLDKDKNKQLSFGEVMPFFTEVMIVAHDHIHQKDGQGQGQGHGHGHGHSH